MLLSKHFQAYASGLLAVTCWTGFVLVSRLGGQSVLSAFDTIALRFMVGCTLLLPLAYFHRPWFNTKGLALSATGGLGYCLFVYAGFKHSSAIHASVLLPGLIPFLSAIFAIALLGEKTTWLRVLGLGFIGLGASLMLLDQNNGNASLLGDGFFILAVVCWAIYTVLAKKWQIASLQATTTVAFVSAAMFLPLYWLFFPTHLPQAPWQTLALQGFYQGFIAVIAAMLFYMFAVEHIGPSKMGALMALVPAASGFLAVPLLGEQLSLLSSIALLLCSFGAFFAAGLFSRKKLSGPAN